MATKTASRTTATSVGPPLVVLGTAFASVAVSVLLLLVGGTRAHVLGYVVGSVLPLLLIGFFRKADLVRRRDPHYLASRLVPPMLVVLAATALVLAAVHVWPIATDLAS